MKIIETDKFILRPVQLTDDKDFFEFLSQDKVVKYLPFNSHRSIHETRRFLYSFFIKNYQSGKVGNYAIFYKPHQKVIGNIGLNNVVVNASSAEIGICINPNYWGHDFATELTICTLVSGFELLNLDKLIAITYDKNKYTPKSLDNLGFKYVNSYKQLSHKYTCNKFELLRSDYYNLKEFHIPSLVKYFSEKE
ncbi:MAG: GNAT family N-acetyltransferase [Peptostreptococcaceae bacterium]